MNKGYIALGLGTCCFLLFAGKPFLLDLIEPSKSIGQIIGENARDLIDQLNSDSPDSKSPSTKRELWSSILTISAFALFALSLIFASLSFSGTNNKTFGIAGGLLATLGLVCYLAHLAIGLVGFVVIAVLVVLLVLFLQG